MRDDFAVFILSHGRADCLTTVTAIQNSGYSGKWFILIDDLDDQKEKYISNFGDHVIVFDKKLWAEKTDTITSTGDLRSVVFARNACQSIAKEMGLSFFAEFDDDLMFFQIRWDNSGKLSGQRVRNLDEVFEAMIEFQQISGAVSIGFANTGGFLGGVKGNFKKGLQRSIHQAFILRTDMPIEFKGLLNEDVNATEIANFTGKLAFEICFLTEEAPVCSSNSGGLNDLYKANDEYVRAFYTIIVCPSNLKIFDRRGSITLRRKSEISHPKIISDRWKK